MSNPFSDDPPAEDNTRLWYRDIPAQPESASASRRFEPDSWNEPQETSHSWAITHDDEIRSSSRAPVRLRAPRRPLCNGICAFNWFAVLIGIALLASLSGLGYFFWWNHERHEASANQFDSLSQSISDIRSDLDAVKQDVATIQIDFKKLKTYVASVNDTSNLGIYNQMLTMKKELVHDMAENKDSVHQELEQSEEKVTALVDETTGDLQRMRANMTEMVKMMNDRLDKTVDYIDNMVARAQHQITLEVRNVSAREEAYVEATKKQFQAENDFVTHQLAGILYYNTISF